MAENDGLDLLEPELPGLDELESEEDASQLGKLELPGLDELVPESEEATPDAVIPWGADSETSIFSQDLYAQWEKAGRIGWPEYAMRFQKNIELIPFLSVGGVVEPGTIMWKMNKLKNDEYGPDESVERWKDYRDVYDYAKLAGELQHRGLSWGAKFWAGGSQSAVFMVELVASLGVYPAFKALAKKGVKEATEKTIKRSLGESLRHYVKTAPRTLAREAVRTGTFMGHRVALNYQDRRLNDQLAITNKGDLIMREATENPATTWAKAFGGIMIENVTEVVGGEAINLAFGAIGRKVSTEFVKKFIDGMPAGKLKSLFTEGGGAGWKALNFKEKGLAWSGIIGEYGEERMADVMRAFTGVDDRDMPLFDKLTEALFPDKEDVLVELGLFSVFGGVSYTSSRLIKRWEQKGMTDEEIDARITGSSETEREFLLEREVELEEQREGLEVPDVSTSEKSLFNKTFRTVFNRFAPIEDVSKAAAEKGIKLDKDADPLYTSRQYLGIGPMIRTTLEDSTYQIDTEGNIEITGEGLKPILDSIDGTLGVVESDGDTRRADFQDYLIARRTLEDLAPRKDVKVTDEQLEKAASDILGLNIKYGADFQKFNEISERIYGYQGRVLENLVLSGQMSEEQYSIILDTNQRYIPFDRVMPEDTAEAEMVKKGFTKAKSPVKEIKGSELEIEDIYESMIKNTIDIMERAQRNKVAKAVANLQNVLPGEILLLQEEIEETDVAGRDNTALTGEAFEEVVAESKEAAKQVVKSLSENDVIEWNGETWTVISQVGESGLNLENNETKEKVLVKDATGMFMSDRVTLPGGEVVQEVAAKVVSEGKGIPKVPEGMKPKGNVIEYYEGGKRKFVEVESELYEAMTGMSEQHLDLFWRMLAAPAGWLRTGATITPDFMMSNFIRDQFTAAIQTNIGFRPFIDPIMAMSDIIGKRGDYLDWIRSGSAYSGLIETGRDSLKKAYEELTGKRTLLQKLNIVTRLSDLSQFFEQATRVGMYRAAKRKGLSDVEAGFEAREGTLDFGVRGASTQQFNAVKSFLNAGIQAFSKTVRTFTENPVKTTMKGLAYITTPTILLYLHNRDDDEYWELPQWRRDLFWNLKVTVPEWIIDSANYTNLVNVVKHPSGDVVWLSIPKPFGLGQVFGTLPERFMQHIDQKDPRAFDDLVGTMLESLLPASSVDYLLPTAFVPAIEGLTNYNFFTGRDLVPDYKLARDPFLQYNKSTSETAKELGKALNISPAKLQNMVQGYLGSSGRYVLEASDALVNGIKKSAGEKVHERPSEVSNLPFVRRFLRSRPFGYQSESVQRFFDLSNKLKSIKNTANDLKRLDPEAYQEYREQNNYEIRMSRRFAKIRGRISGFGKQIDIIMESDSSDQDKLSSIDKIERSMTELAKETLEDYEGGK